MFKLDLGIKRRSIYKKHFNIQINDYKINNFNKLMIIGLIKIVCEDCEAK